MMIKSILILAAAVATISQATKTDDRLYDPAKMTDTEAVSVHVNVVKHIYTSFINGWY